MGKVYEGIDEKLAAWIEQQHLFFVATAPLAEDGHVNISPKGDLRWLRILGPREVAYLDRRQRRGDDRARTRERPHRRNVLRVRGPAEDRAPARPRVGGAARGRTIRPPARSLRPRGRRAALGDPHRGRADRRLVRLRRAAHALRREALAVRRLAGQESARR